MSDQPDSGTEPSARTWVRPLLAGSLAVILACLASLAALLVLKALDVDLPGDGDEGLSDEREQVMSTATQFVLRINTFGPDDLDKQGKMPDYVARVEQLMTSKFGTEFSEAQQIPEQLVSQADVGRSSTVNAVGVSTISEDSATVVAAFEVTNSYPSAKKQKQRTQDLPVPMRWEISMRMVEGEWLVDDYEVIPEQQGDGASPSVPPTGEGSPGGLPTAPQSPTGNGNGGGS